MSIYVHTGYAAVNLSANPSKENKWIGIIQGNIYCKKVREKSSKALSDAKKLYDKQIKP